MDWYYLFLTVMQLKEFEQVVTTYKCACVHACAHVQYVRVCVCMVCVHVVACVHMLGCSVGTYVYMQIAVYGAYIHAAVMCE